MSPPSANPSPRRSSGGLSRAALSRKDATPGAALPARAQRQGARAVLKPEDEEPATLRRAAYRAGPEPTAGGLGRRDALHIIVGVLLGSPLLVGLLLGLRMMGDGLSAASHLSEAKALRSVLICQDGEVVRGDGTLPDLFLADPVFVCTEWRTLQSLEADEAALRR